MNILAKTGLTITLNKDSVKAILDKYKISYGNGSTGEIIKAVFIGIKGGNKDLATDIAGLVTAQDQAVKKTFGSLSFKDVFNKAKADIFDKIHLSKKKVKEATPAPVAGAAPSISAPAGKSQYYADGSNGTPSTGDPVADTALQLTNALSTTDVDTATNIAVNAKDPSTLIPYMPIIVTILFIGVGLWWLNRK